MKPWRFERFSFLDCQTWYLLSVLVRFSGSCFLEREWGRTLLTLTNWE